MKLRMFVATAVAAGVVLAAPPEGAFAVTGRPIAAARCAQDIVTVLDMEDPASTSTLEEVEAYVDTMSLKCLRIGAKAEVHVTEGWTPEEVADWLKLTVTRKYGSTVQEVSQAYCDLFGC